MSFKFLAGVALGAVIVHFLNTDEGKAFINRFRSDVKRTEEGLSEIAENLVQKGKDLINGAGEKIEEEIPGSLIVVVESNPVV